MSENLIKIEEFKGVDIYLNRDESIFKCTYGGALFTDRDLVVLRRELQKSTIIPLSGEVFVKDLLDGFTPAELINEFISNYENKKLITIRKKNKYSGGIETVDPEDVFPNSEHNKALWEEHEKREKEGWKLINSAKALHNKLEK